MIPTPNDQSFSLLDRDLMIRIMADVGEMARRVHGISTNVDDPADVRTADALTLNEYQKSALLTANLTRTQQEQIINAALGLGGESAEVVGALHQISTMITTISGNTVDNVKKYLFHNWSDAHIDKPGSYEQMREKLGKELGDLMWYIAVLAYLFQWDLGEIAKMNRAKLIERHGQKFNPKMFGGEENKKIIPSTILPLITDVPLTKC